MGVVHDDTLHRLASLESGRPVHPFCFDREMAIPSSAEPYLDISDPSFSVRSAAVREARERGWYAHTNYGLAVLRYDEVKRLLKDPRLRQGSAAWPAHNGVEAGPFVDWWSKALLNLEGTDHTRLRRLLTPAFEPRLIRGLAPSFGGLAEELIDAFATRGRCEFMSEFAEPYAARAIAIVLGLPEREWCRIAAWSSDLGLALSVAIRSELERIEAALEGLYGYADELIADRRHKPGDDFVSRLVEAQHEQDRLSQDELRVSVVLLIFGGMDTTRNQLGLALETFLEHPEQWRLLGERPELGAAATEEVMRINPTVTWVTREACEDFELEGLAIAAGTTLHLLTESAGTDPLRYGEAGFEITAERARHFGFGAGVHRCIGHMVARTDISEALPRLARRLRAPRLDGEPRSLPRSGNTGPTELPIAFEPAG
jgi:cytochrome P450